MRRSAVCIRRSALARGCSQAASCLSDVHMLSSSSCVVASLWKSSSTRAWYLGCKELMRGIRVSQHIGSWSSSFVVYCNVDDILTSEDRISFPSTVVGDRSGVVTRLRSPTTVDGKDVRLITGVSSWTRLDTIFFRTVNHKFTTVWSNYQTSYNDFFEVYITETVTYHLMVVSTISTV